MRIGDGVAGNVGSELWGVSTFFNPADYANKRSHFIAFANRVRRQGLKLLAMEVAFGGKAPSLPEGVADAHILIRADTVLWQKERLLNMALELLPGTCGQIAWLDGDIMFARADWVAAARSALRQHPVIQLFETAWFLPPPASIAPVSAQAAEWVSDAHRHCMLGVAKAFHDGEFEPILKGWRQPGLAWAATRDFLENVGFYDKLILGGGDTATVMALLGMHEHEYILGTFENWWSPALYRDVMHWASHVNRLIAGNVGYIPGIVYHMWHGNRANRSYGGRQLILRENDFDPSTDISKGPNGCWTWVTDKPRLHESVARYFDERKEDLVPHACQTDSAPVPLKR
jgi:hypothetical protein